MHQKAMLQLYICQDMRSSTQLNPSKCFIGNFKFKCAIFKFQYV